MITISLCMIVKNEEKILARCLDSLKDYVDEIIIADTGSTDRTREIAASYTDKVFDYVWENDFSKARNFVFEKATMDYIYSADADEFLDMENRKRLQILKQAMLPEIDIVQMYYCNQLTHNTVYNYDKEYRPKLFKRLRTFHWVDPVHETVITEPVIFDSDIEIIHMPQNEHASRDFSCFAQLIKDHTAISPRLRGMYARELFIAGTKEDFQTAAPVFEAVLDCAESTTEQISEACCVLARCSFLSGNDVDFFSHALKNVAGSGSSEICCMLGDYYYERHDYNEASLWYHNAAYETECLFNIRYKEEFAPAGLLKCKRAMEK